MILGFMDQIPLYNAYNFSLPSNPDAFESPNTNIVGGPLSFLANTSVVSSMVASYVCPSDIYPSAIHATVRRERRNTRHAYARESNYFVVGATYYDTSCPGIVNYQPTTLGLPFAITQGAFFNDLSVNFAQIRDGTSNTLLCGESLQTPGKSYPYYGPYWGAGVFTSTYGEIWPPLGLSS